LHCALATIADFGWDSTNVEENVSGQTGRLKPEPKKTLYALQFRDHPDQ
jgi:hypothetical protein